jgi:hypothetical protein
MTRNYGQGMASFVQRVMNRRVARRQGDEQHSATKGQEYSRFDEETNLPRQRDAQSIADSSFHERSPALD